MGFNGGDRLANILAEIQKNAESGAFVKVGFLDKATYTATPGANPVFVAQVAYWNNFGTSRMSADGKTIVRTPPRPFFSQMIAANSGSWGSDLAKILRHNGYNSHAALELMGERMEDQLKAAIVDFNSVPLKESTIARKGNADQLKDTKTMLRSISYEVEA